MKNVTVLSPVFCLLLLAGPALAEHPKRSACELSCDKIAARALPDQDLDMIRRADPAIYAELIEDCVKECEAAYEKRARK